MVHAKADEQSLLLLQFELQLAGFNHLLFYLDLLLGLHLLLPGLFQCHPAGLEAEVSELLHHRERLGLWLLQPAHQRQARLLELELFHAEHMGVCLRSDVVIVHRSLHFHEPSQRRRGLDGLSDRCVLLVEQRLRLRAPELGVWLYAHLRLELGFILLILLAIFLATGFYVWLLVVNFHDHEWSIDNLVRQHSFGLRFLGIPISFKHHLLLYKEDFFEAAIEREDLGFVHVVVSR